MKPVIIVRLGAALFALAIVVPLLLWASPYPAGAVHYWLAYGTATVAVSMLIAFLAPGMVDRVVRAARMILARPTPRTFAILLCLVTAAAAAACAVLVFDRGPSTSDELAQLFHARILLSGRLALPADPNPEFFAIDNVIDHGRWYSHFPIGGPLLLAAGLLAHAAWLVNPVLLGVAAAAFYWFGRRAFGDMEGRTAGVLLPLSVFPLLMSGTYMNHVPAMCMALCALAAVAEWDRSEERRRIVAGILIGVFVGFMATLRPLDAVVLALVIGIFQLTRIARDTERRRELGWQIAGGLTGVAPLLVANTVTNGSPLRFGYDVLYGAPNRLGFHVDPYGGVHTLGSGLEYAMTMVSELNLAMTAWPLPIILFVITALLVRRTATKWDALIVTCFWAQAIAYVFYWGEGEFLGPRFLFTVAPLLLLMIVRGRTAVHPQLQRAASVLLLGCVAVGWAAPPSSYGARRLASEAHKARRSLRVHVEEDVAKANIHNALILLREPMSNRIARRIYGLGLTHTEAQRLLSTSDGCSLLAAVRTAETSSRETALQQTFQVAPYAPGAHEVHLTDQDLHLNSEESLTPTCRAELADDERVGIAAFGPVLPLEPIGEDGRLSGDVIYAADLNERNDVLRARFADRTWYRLRLLEEDGEVHAVITPDSTRR